MDEIVLIESNRHGAGRRTMQLARTMGYRVRLLTRDPDYYGDGPHSPIALADLVDQTDTFDASRILHHLDHVRTRAVLAFNDYYLMPAALAAMALGLPHADIRGLINARYKDRTRRALSGRPGTPGFRVLATDCSDLDLAPPTGFPCVVKPVDDSGSHGVCICRTQAELVAAVAALRARRHNARGYALSPRFLIEDYVDGPEFSAELFWNTSAHDWHLLGFTRKRVTPPPEAFELGHLFPHRFAGTVGRQIELRLRDWLSAIGHIGAAAHVEFRLQADGTPVCMEINPRLGGDKIDTLIHRTCGIDPVEWYLAYHLGAPVCPSEIVVPEAPVAEIRFVLSPSSGTVTTVALERQPDPSNRVDVALDPSLPRQVVGDGRMTDRLGHIIAVAEDPLATDSLIKAMIDLIQIDLRSADEIVP